MMFLAFVKDDCLLIGIQLTSPYDPKSLNLNEVHRNGHHQIIWLRDIKKKRNLHFITFIFFPWQLSNFANLNLITFG